MQTVADSPYGINIFLLRYCFYLFPDIADMYIQCLCLSHIVFIPRIFKNLFFAEDLFRMLQ